jgi:hypothetical protein
VYASVVWNKLTSTGSIKIENIQRKFPNLGHYRYFQFSILRNYDLIPSHLNFRKFFSNRRHLDALFLINVFKGKINCHYYIMDTVGIRVPTKQIREFSTFSVSSALRYSPSARCVIVGNNICRFLGIFEKKNILF